MAGVNKTEFIKKFSEAQKIQRNNLSGQVQIKLYMGNFPVKIRGNFWRKGPLYKTNMLMLIPNSSHPLKYITIFDGKTIWRISNGTIVKLTVNKLPKQISAFGTINDFLKNVKKYSKETKITEKTKNNKKYYVFTSIGKNINYNIAGYQKILFWDDIIICIKTLPYNISGIQKIVLWINEKNMLTKQIELYGKNKQPDVLIVFKNLSTKPIHNSMFIYKPSQKTKVVDLTKMVKSVILHMNNLFL
jgi:outer membrane lipoprotein-sorting protein